LKRFQIFKLKDYLNKGENLFSPVFSLFIYFVLDADHVAFDLGAFLAGSGRKLSEAACLFIGFGRTNLEWADIGHRSRVARAWIKLGERWGRVWRAEARKTGDIDIGAESSAGAGRGFQYRQVGGIG
jgi:hypothetical protein